MTPFLLPLRNSLWLRVTSLALSCGILGVTIWQIVVSLLGQGLVPAIYITSGVLLLTTVFLGRVIAIYSVKATDFLARAILLVAQDNNYVAAPNPNDLNASKDFLVKLTKNVYDLASSQASRLYDFQHKKISEVDYYRSMVDSIPLPVIILDSQQQVAYANEAALNYVELTAEAVIGKPLYEPINLSFSNSTLGDWLQSCRTNNIVSSEVWERVRLNLPENRRKQFDLAAHYSKDDPRGLETTLVLFDKTAVYERDDHDFTFVSLAVHELRTPLTIMRGYIEIFEDELGHVLNKEQATFMYNMSASAKQLTSFVSNILNVSRIEENALYLRLKEENWADTLHTACQDMELRAKVHNKRLIYDVPNNLPTVAVDKVSIYEVVANLLDNAIKYTHTDEDILIKTYTKDDMIETTITDKGVGIPDALVEHIFDKFYRGHNSKNSVGGTGLGLFLCRTIVNAHGGNIWVHSREGEGSTFGFTLPLYANVADQIKNEDNKGIVRGAHGWIKNHSFYRE
jgi:signal transduction histidine kinase